MRFLFAFLTLGVLLLAGCGGSDGDKSDDSASPPKAEKNADVDNDVLEDFDSDVAMKSCVEAAEETGVSSDAAEEYCECAMERIVDEIGVEGLAEFGVSLMGDEDMDEEQMDAIEDIIIDCSSIIMDEIDLDLEDLDLE